MYVRTYVRTVCVYTYHIYVRTCVYCTSTYVRMYLPTYILCMCICTHTYTYSMYVHMHTYVRIRTVCMYTCIVRSLPLLSHALLWLCRPAIPDYFLDFGFVVYGNVLRRSMFLVNTGHCPINISVNKKALVGSGFSADATDKIKALPEGEKVNFTVTFDPASINCPTREIMANLPFKVIYSTYTCTCMHSMYLNSCTCICTFFFQIDIHLYAHVCVFIYVYVVHSRLPMVPATPSDCEVLSPYPIWRCPPRLSTLVLCCVVSVR